MLNVKEIVGFLHKVPLFHGLSQHQLEKLAKRFIERDYEGGQVIVTQGQGGVGFFIIVSGKAEVVRQRAEGEKVVVNAFGPTDFFGELALLDDGPRTATVTAVEATKCLALTSWDFLAEVREDADMAIIILQELAVRFRRALEAL
jgi:CRP/FNR family transcriptional regulator, cyclic AMP receptor protein